jgi:hypothetical protein
MDTLLKHGGPVAQGVSLAVKAIHDLLPVEEKNVAIQDFAERPHTSGDHK